MILDSFQLFQSFQLFHVVRSEVGSVGRKECEKRISTCRGNPMWLPVRLRAQREVGVLHAKDTSQRRWNLL